MLLSAPYRLFGGSLQFTCLIFSIASSLESCHDRPPSRLPRLIFIFPHRRLFVYVTPLSKFPSLLIASAPKLCSCSAEPGAEPLAALHRRHRRNPLTQCRYFVADAVGWLKMKLRRVEGGGSRCLGVSLFSKFSSCEK